MVGVTIIFIILIIYHEIENSKARKRIDERINYNKSQVNDMLVTIKRITEDSGTQDERQVLSNVKNINIGYRNNSINNINLSDKNKL